MMKHLSRQIVLMLLTATMLGLATPALAEVSLTVGVVSHVGGPFDEPERGKLLVDQLAQHLAAPVRVRMLSSELELLSWMSRFREVDCGWFSEAFLEQLPAGELLPLVSVESGPGVSAPGQLAVRQGLDAGTVERLQTALVSMGSSAAESQLLGSLGIARFIPSPALPGAEQRRGSLEIPLPLEVAALVTVAAPVEVSTPLPEATPLTVATPATVVTPVEVTAPVPAREGGGQRPSPLSPAEAAKASKAPVDLAADRLDYDWGQDLYRASGAVAIRQAEMDLKADQVLYDQNGDLYRADGSVVAQQGETRLTADKLIWQASTRDAVAVGAVNLSDADGELQGSSAYANLASQRGRVNDGKLFLKASNFHLTGKEIERLDQSSYQVVDGEFTTCDGETPDWKFSAKQVNVDFGRYAVARDVWFEVRDLPLFYLPYMVFPVLTERESGFLVPSFGYSERKGAFLSLAWYQVIDRNLDATIYLDYLSEIGLGKGLEFRYAFGKDSFGEMKGYHISGFDNALDSDDNQNNDTDMPDSYSLSWQHGGMLPGKVWLAADVEYVDNIEYFEEFGDSADQYTRDVTISTVLLQRNWDKLNLTGFARYINDLRDESDITGPDDDPDNTLQRLPELGLTVPFYRLDENPLYSRTRLTATHFWREDENETAGLENGQRFLLRQGLSLVMKAGEWLELTPEVAAYGRYYTGVDGEESDLIPEYSATLSSRLQRVYAVSGWGNIDRVQHSIEPQVTYRYVGNYDQEELPYYDPYDRINDDNLILYALVNRLTGRTLDADGNRSYRELLNLRLSQSYDVDEARNDKLSDPQPFSSLRAELKVNPTPETALSVDSWIPVHGDQRFARVNASASYTASAGNSAAVNYSYVRDEPVILPEDPYVLAPTPSEYIGLELSTAHFAPVYVNFQERYDLMESQALESVVNLEYREKCWSLFLTLRNRSAGDDRPSENEVMVGFALSGLGRIGGFGSALP